MEICKNNYILRKYVKIIINYGHYVEITIYYGKYVKITMYHGKT